MDYSQAFFFVHVTPSPPLTSWGGAPVVSLLSRPDQKRCAQEATPLHWSGFLRSREEEVAQLVRSVPWLSSPRQLSLSMVPMMRVKAACWARDSVTSSSYRLNA